MLSQNVANKPQQQANNKTIHSASHARVKYYGKLVPDKEIPTEVYSYARKLLNVTRWSCAYRLTETENKRDSSSSPRNVNQHDDLIRDEKKTLRPANPAKENNGDRELSGGRGTYFPGGVVG